MEGVVFKHFDGCGHYLHQEQPEAFVTAVRDFLDDPTAIAVRLKAAASSSLGEHVIVDAVDERSVQIEEKRGRGRHARHAPAVSRSLGASSSCQKRRNPC